MFGGKWTFERAIGPELGGGLCDFSQDIPIMDVAFGVFLDFEHSLSATASIILE